LSENLQLDSGVGGFSGITVVKDKKIVFNMKKGQQNNINFQTGTFLAT